MFSIIKTLVLGGQYVGQQQSQPNNIGGNYGNQIPAVGGTTTTQYTAPGGSTVQGQYPNTSQTYTGASTSQTYQANQQSQTGYNQFAQTTGNVAPAKSMSRVQG